MNKSTLFFAALLAACGGTETIDHSAPDGGTIQPRTGPEEHEPGACPHIDLGNQVPVSWDGSTAGLPNHVESTRLEWEDAPDDSLAFTAPADGDYVVYFESSAPGFGVSARSYGPAMDGRGPFYTPADCPASGQTKLIDGVYNHNQPGYPLTLQAGETILLWVSGAYWADAETTDYTLRVEKAASPGQARVFVSSAQYTGALGGLAGADAKCQTLADAAGLGGSWVAWLSDASSDAIDRITGTGPWVRVDGEPVFASKDALADPFQDPEIGLWLDEEGRFLASDRIWTGTGADGRHVSSIGDSCQAWTSSAMSDQARIGQVGRSDSAWTGFAATSCDQSGVRIICFEQ